MREANSPIHPDDLQAMTRHHQAYLGDEDGLTTKAAKLQDDAYALGYQRAIAEHCERNLNMVLDGWRIAPIDPTPVMRIAGARDCSALLQPDQAAEVYSAMLKHAPAPSLAAPRPAARHERGGDVRQGGRSYPLIRDFGGLLSRPSRKG